jgi:WD40 repeat protein
LTSGNDGTVKLWHVGEGKCLRSWKVGKGARKRVTKLALCSYSDTQADDATDDLQGKVAIAGLEDGQIALLSLASPASDPPKYIEQISPSGKAISALAVQRQEEGYRIAVGTVDGRIAICNLTSADNQLELLGVFKRNDADITSLDFGQIDKGRSSLLVGTSDGLPFEVSLSSSSEDGLDVKVMAELAGYDIDACNAVCFVEGEVYTAGMDGHLRRY